MPTIDGLYYGRRKAITISHANVGSTLGNFPLCVRINGDADMGGVCRTDGTDLRFTDADGNLLYAQEEFFSVVSAAATGLFWVGVPSISAGADTTIYGYYGNQQAHSQSGSTNVWDANFHGVWHLNEATMRFSDSTSYHNNSSSTTNFPTAVTGLLGKAQLFSRADSSYITVDYASSLGNTGPFSLSAWINLSTIPSTQPYEIACKGQDCISYAFRVGVAGRGVVYYMSDESTFQQLTTTDVVFPATATWYHACGVYDGSYLRFYVNGVQQQTLATSGAPGTDLLPLVIGSLAGQSAFCMDGVIDELRFSNIARSADWISFEYYNQKDLTGQLTWGPQQTFATRRLIDGSLVSGTPLLETLA